MKKSLLLLALIACQSRTELVFGVATDLRAPDALDTVQLEIANSGNGINQQQLVWDLSGQVNVPFNLPGSYGVVSGGDEISITAVLTGFKNGEALVTRRSIVSLVEGETLFYRIGLTAGCIDRLDCPETSSCVEGVCRDVNVPSNQLPDFDAGLVTELSCAAGAVYLDTGTGDPMPLGAGAETCPAGLCLEGTCLKPPPAESGTRTVRGSKIETFLLPNNQIMQVPVDLSTLQVAAIVSIDGQALPMTISGSGAADGTFSIPNVPKGTYTLQVGTQFTVTSADNVDLGFVELGRPNRTAVVDPSTTGLDISVTGMSPWADGNSLSLYSPTANDWWFGFDQSMATPPAVGQTQLTNVPLTFDDGSSAAANHMASDPVALIQYTNKTADDGITTYLAATKFVSLTSFTTTEGQLKPFTGAFTDLAQTETVTLDARQLEWENAVGWDGTRPTLINPAAIPADFLSLTDVPAPQVGMDLLGQPGGPKYGNFSATLDYLFLRAPSGKNSTFSNLTFGKPDIGGYVFTPALFAGVSFRVPYQLPGTNNPTSQFIKMFSLRVADTSTFTVTPVLGPVRDPRFDGTSLFQSIQNVNPTGTISWSSPSVGFASQYTVRFFKLSVNANNNTVKTNIANLTTTDTSVVVPPGILTPGDFCYVLIIASDDGNIDAPLRRRFPSSIAQIASAQFTVGAGTNPPRADGGMDDSGTGPIDATAPPCDPLSQTGCSAGLACYSNASGAQCMPPGTKTPGMTCAANNECIQGSGCAGVCRTYCNFAAFPNMQGTCAVGQTCQAFNPDAGLCQ